MIELTGDAYSTDIEPERGPPGTTVNLFGSTLRGEDGRWTPADRLEAWWNTEVPANEVPGRRPVEEGLVQKLVEVDDMERCDFEAEFTVPDVEPGTYVISVFVWDVPPSDDYGFFLPHRFTVTKP